MELAKGQYLVKLEADQVLCTEGEKNADLFIIHEGKLLICIRDKKSSQVTPLAYLEKGEYLGELSFFDREARSADVIAVEPTTLVRIPEEELGRQFPQWLVTLASTLTKRLRLMDEVVRDHGLKRKNVTSMAPLDMAVQGKFFKILKDYDSTHNP